MTSVACACGCGERFPERDGRGRPRRFVSGHNRRGRFAVHYNGGLSRDRSSGRWRIVCRDGTQMLYSRGVMAAELGRLLSPDEIVHHKNENPSDDRVENLELTTRPEHVLIHDPRGWNGTRA